MSESRTTINGNVEFSLLLRAVPFNAKAQPTEPATLYTLVFWRQFLFLNDAVKPILYRIDM